MIRIYKCSIIIPIFNQEKYLENCLESIINQSIGFENLELILVDDCSTDNSKNIIKEYSFKYDNIKTIFLETNSGGAGKPKNEGLKIASSDFIAFVDPDDEMLENGFKLLYNEIIKEDADIVSANAINNISGEGRFVDIIYKNNKDIIYPNNSLEEFQSYRLWGSIIKKSIIKENNIKFLSTKTNEDTYFAYKLFLKSKKIVYLNDEFVYIYNTRESGSLSTTISLDKILSTIEAFTIIRQLFIDENQLEYFKIDPCIQNIYWRFGQKWNMSKEDKLKILGKMYDYCNESPFPIVVKSFYRPAQYFLMKKQFKIVLIIQNIMSSLIANPFLVKYVFSKLNKREEYNE